MTKRQQSVAGVTIEWDDAKHAKLNAKDGSFDKTKIPHSKNNDDEFTPARIVADLKLDLGSAGATTVNLNDVHLALSYQGSQPTLGWWNGAKWVKFKQVTYANGVADVILPSPWPTDPPIGVYP